MMKKLLLLLCPILLFSACQKDPDVVNTDAGAADCKPMKLYVFENSTVASDSALYEYTNEQLSKVSLGGSEYIAFDYNNGQVVKRSFIDNSNPMPYGYQTFAYNTDGSFSKIETYLNNPPYSNSKSDSTDFIYTSGKLSAIKYYSAMSLSANGQVLFSEYRFTYTGNNITRVQEKEYANGNLQSDDTYLFTFDSKPNYFRKQSATFLQTDPYFVDADYTFFAFALSENNIIKSQDAGSPANSSTFGYTTDAKGNLSDLQVDGQTILRYTYQCK